MIDPVNAAELGATGAVVCLTASVETIHDRVRIGIESRPMLRGADAEERIAALLAERAPAYAPFTQVPTDDRSVDEIVDAVLALI